MCLCLVGCFVLVGWLVSQCLFWFELICFLSCFVFFFGFSFLVSAFSRFLFCSLVSSFPCLFYFILFFLCWFLLFLICFLFWFVFLSSFLPCIFAVREDNPSFDQLFLFSFLCLSFVFFGPFGFSSFVFFAFLLITSTVG